MEPREVRRDATDLLRSVVRRAARYSGRGCAATPAYVPETQPLEPGRLPAPDVVVKVPGLGSCTDASDRSVHLITQINRSPCRYTAAKAPPGAFHSLAQLYAFHGQ